MNDNYSFHAALTTLKQLFKVVDHVAITGRFDFDTTLDLAPSCA